MIKAIKFYADWCKPCGVLSNNLKDKDIESINVEENIELASKYSIRNLPTILFFKNDELIEKKVGVITGEEFDSIINSLSI
jgi:thioredoxin 1